jgi:hypothetical protein
MHRPIRLTVLIALLVGLLGAPAAAAEGRRTYTGTIGAAAYRVELPQSWNGTLVLYSHG